ncbi:hypothetical protein [Burkholderia glumae]|nr:hypothetical protein [Burkholderia glumae]QJP72059.1 hypothetical protein HJC54_18040 [Burkholderia glumae]
MNPLIVLGNIAASYGNENYYYGDAMDNNKNLCLVDFINEIPNKGSKSYQEKVDAAKMKVTLAVRHELDEARKMCKKFKAQYDGRRDSESFAGFCEWRSKVAGLVSGEKKKKRQAEKLVYLFEILAINHVPDDKITYTFIQFLSKQIDGRGMDKEKCLELRTQFKSNKRVYQVPDDKQQLWAAIRLNYSMSGKVGGVVQRRKI